MTASFLRGRPANLSARDSTRFFLINGPIRSVVFRTNALRFFEPTPKLRRRTLPPDESFVFSVTHLGEGLVASGDDAGNLCAARVPSEGGGGSTKKPAKVVYKHPNTVWSVAGLRRDASRRPAETGKRSRSSPVCAEAADATRAARGFGGAGGGTAAMVADVATGSADHAVRIFTPDAGRALCGDRLQEAEEALGEGGDVCTPIPGGAGSGFGGKLPSVAEMGVMVGARDGQLSAFADEATGAAQVGSVLRVCNVCILRVPLFLSSTLAFVFFCSKMPATCF